MKSSRIVDALKSTIRPPIVRVGGFKFIRFHARRINRSPLLPKAAACAWAYTGSKPGCKEGQAPQSRGFQFLERGRLFV